MKQREGKEMPPVMTPPQALLFLRLGFEPLAAQTLQPDLDQRPPDQIIH